MSASSAAGKRRERTASMIVRGNKIVECEVVDLESGRKKRLLRQPRSVLLSSMHPPFGRPCLPPTLLNASKVEKGPQISLRLLSFPLTLHFSSSCESDPKISDSLPANTP